MSKLKIDDGILKSTALVLAIAKESIAAREKLLGADEGLTSVEARLQCAYEMYEAGIDPLNDEVMHAVALDASMFALKLEVVLACRVGIITREETGDECEG